MGMKSSPRQLQEISCFSPQGECRRGHNAVHKTTAAPVAVPVLLVPVDRQDVDFILVDLFKASILLVDFFICGLLYLIHFVSKATLLICRVPESSLPLSLDFPNFDYLGFLFVKNQFFRTTINVSCLIARPIGFRALPCCCHRVGCFLLAASDRLRFHSIIPKLNCRTCFTISSN